METMIDDLYDEVTDWARDFWLALWHRDKAKFMLLASRDAQWVISRRS
jgi:hypothetical protein